MNKVEVDAENKTFIITETFSSDTNGDRVSVGVISSFNKT